MSNSVEDKSDSAATSGGSSSSSSRPDTSNSLAVTMVSATLSGMLARIPLHPLDTCKAKMQVTTKQQLPSHVHPSAAAVMQSLQHPTANAPSAVYHYRGVIDCLQHTYRYEGLRGLYKGFGITVFGSAPAMCLYMTTYEASKTWMQQSPAASSVPVFAQHFMAGLFAESVSCVLWVPIDVIKERLQTQTNLLQYLQSQQSQSATAASQLKELQQFAYTGNIDAIRKIASTEGLRGIYKGYGATVASFGPFSALYLAGYDNIKSRFERLLLPPQNLTQQSGTTASQLPPWAFLLSGGLAGGIASFVTNPLDLAKLRIQVQRRQPMFSFHYRNIVDGLVQIVRTEGYAGLLKGVTARLAFQVPASAMTVGTFDIIRQAIVKLQSGQPAQKPA